MNYILFKETPHLNSQLVACNRGSGVWLRLGSFRKNLSKTSCRFRITGPLLVTNDRNSFENKSTLSLLPDSLSSISCA